MSLPRQLLQYRYTALAVAIAFLAALFPLLGTDDVGHIAWTASLWCVLVAAIRSLSEPRSPLDRLARVLGWVAVAASASSLWCFSTADQGHGLAYFIIHSLTLAFLLATGLCERHGTKTRLTPRHADEVSRVLARLGVIPET